MRTNEKFLEAVKKSFATYLAVGTSSTAKLKTLHGHIANDLEPLFEKNFQSNHKDTETTKKIV